MPAADEPTPPKKRRTLSTWERYASDPRSAVLTFLVAALVFGGGRKVLQGVRARRAIAALSGPDPSPEEVEASAEHGRAALIELFRLLGTAEKAEVRDAAGRALAALWAKDEMITEEEKALVRRGFAVDWKARRRYPRGLKVPIPIEASYGIPFLIEDGPGVRPSNLAWSHRILGSERAGLEEESAWAKGLGMVSFALYPSDFPTLGPHRLALAAKARVVGLTDTWEVELPHVPFSFEFDPNLSVDALLTSPDGPREAALMGSIGFETAGGPEFGSRYLDLSPGLLLRDAPDLIIKTPLPCDLAHSLEVEIEGIPGRFRAGSVVVAGQGNSGRAEARRFPIGPIANLPPDAIDGPGDRRIRAVLTADPDLGWADPDVRSLWPGTLITDWAAVRVVRR